MVEQIGPRVTRVGIVGCSTIARWKIIRLIKKTDSLIMPIVGIIEVKSFEFPTTANAVIHEFLLSYHNARWAVEKYTTRVWSTETGDGDQHFGWKYKTDAEKSVEECFNAE